MSYVGNWCPKPEKSILPCTRQLLGRGPIQDYTTQKCDFTWKCGTPEAGFRPEASLGLSRAPFECKLCVFLFDWESVDIKHVRRDKSAWARNPKAHYYIISSACSVCVYLTSLKRSSLLSLLLGRRTTVLTCVLCSSPSRFSLCERG